MTILDLSGLRVLVTQAGAFMGPVLCEVFGELGADVVADDRAMIEPELPAAIVREAGRVDVLLANLAITAPTTPAVLLIGSAAALRGMKRTSTYSAARGAQLAYIQAVGVEAASHNVQINAIAQNFVDNPTYFPPEVQALPAFQERLRREVPLGRLVAPREDALFAAFLCSDATAC